MKKNSSLFWWLPTLILLGVLYPMNIKAFDAYISVGMTSVGIFSLWLTFGYFLAFDVQERNNQSGIIFAILTVLYNPAMSKYTLANMLAAINHLYAVILNLIVAAIFIYQWWTLKHKTQH